MRKLLLTAALILTSAPAFACQCQSVNAQTLLADPAISLADVTVAGMNMANHQSALTVNNTRHGGLVAQHIRAKFGSDDCATIPQWHQNMTMLIHNDDDGSYSILGQCETRAVLQGGQ